MIGIIQNAEPEVVRLVEDLVISHIKGNCLILVALPMTGTFVTGPSHTQTYMLHSTDDIENQKALRLARQVDPDGKRTIGILLISCISVSALTQLNRGNDKAGYVVGGIDPSPRPVARCHRGP